MTFETKPMTQVDMLDEELLRGSEVSALDVVGICKTTTPSKIISNLRKDRGDKLKQEWHISPYSGKRYMLYWYDPKWLEGLGSDK